MPESETFYDQTTVHPIGAAVLAMCCLAVLAAPRRYALVPFLVLVCLVPSAQRVVLLGLDWSFVRILTVAGLLRVLTRGEYNRMRWIPLDWLVLAWIASGTLIMTLQQGSFA